jgi:peptidoglycan/LPS O-acetylase OafA/YrhL
VYEIEVMRAASGSESTRPETPAAPTSTAGRCAALDGLRGVAILLVLASQFCANVPHASGSWAARAASKLANYGGAGITLFFLLSGFWIARSLVRQHGRPGGFRGFYLRRAVRILPLYAGLLITTVVAAKVLYPLDADHWETAVKEHMPAWVFPAFLQNVFMAVTGTMSCDWVNPTWALAVEVQFYVILPVAVWFCTPRWLPLAACCGIAGCWVFRGVMDAREAHAYLSALTLPGRADSLCLGVLLACAWEHAPARAWLLRQRRNLLLVGVGAGVAFVLLSEGVGAGAVDAVFFVGGSTLIAVAFAGLIVAALTREHGRAARLLAWRPLVFWGGISFFVYLAHQPVNSLLHKFALRDWPQVMSAAGIGVTLGSVAVLAGLGALSRRWLERPLIVWSRRVRFGREIAAEAMPAGYAPPLVRWTRGLVGFARRSRLRPARAVVRVR